MLIAGIVIKLIGLVGISVNYPLCKKCLKAISRSTSLTLYSLQIRLLKPPRNNDFHFISSSDSRMILGASFARLHLTMWV